MAIAPPALADQPGPGGGGGGGAGGAGGPGGPGGARPAFGSANLAPDNVKPPLYRYGDPLHANLSGVWQPVGSMAGAVRGRVPLTPAYVAKLNEIRRRSDIGDPPTDSSSLCIANAMPRYMTLPFELIQTPGQVTMVSYFMNDIRRIYLDGRGHTPDIEPTYNGDSVAHWDGDTLVVETNNLLAGVMDNYGIPYSDKMSIVERFSRTSPNTLTVTTTMTDPDALTHPWTSVLNYKLMAEGIRQEEYRCTNNRFSADEGKTKKGSGE